MRNSNRYCSNRYVRFDSEKSLFDCDLKEKSVLKDSTVEHIGISVYGTNEEKTVEYAIEKILRELLRCLITVP